MKLLFKVVVAMALSTGLLCAQDLSREQRFNRVVDKAAEVRQMELELFAPSAEDVRRATELGLEVVRLMPREGFDRKLLTQGGGSYYSFVTRSHDYQKIAQIGFEQGYLKTGFAGADYGLMADLGSVSLGDVNGENAAVAFLLAYRPPKLVSEVRKEQSRAINYATDHAVYKRDLKAVVGNSYVVRAILFDQADTLVVFTIVRVDTDKSLILYWKTISNFDKPELIRDDLKD